MHPLPHLPCSQTQRLLRCHAHIVLNQTSTPGMFGLIAVMQSAPPSSSSLLLPTYQQQYTHTFPIALPFSPRQDKPMMMRTSFEESRWQWKEAHHSEAEARARAGIAHEAQAATKREAHTASQVLRYRVRQRQGLPSAPSPSPSLTRTRWHCQVRGNRGQPLCAAL